MASVTEDVGQVLDQRAAPRDVEHLHATADAEDRQVSVERRVDETELGLVAGVVDTSRRGLTLGAVERGVDVSAADQ